MISEKKCDFICTFLFYYLASNSNFISLTHIYLHNILRKYGQIFLICHRLSSIDNDAIFTK